MSRSRGAWAPFGTTRLTLIVLVGLLASAGPASATVDYTVTNVGDAGPGSLRQAMLDANSASDFNNILFNIPGAGVHTITPTSATLPQVTGPVNLDGTSQPGYAGTPLIQLDGSGLGPCICDGLQILAPTHVQGLDVTGWGRDGIFILGKTAAGTTVENTYIGTNPTGTAAAGNENGVILADTVSVTIQDNLISGNTSAGGGGFGVYLTGRTKNNVIRRNLIGTNWSGSTAIPNSKAGIAILGAANTIGGPVPADGNVISGNGTHGIILSSLAGSPKVAKNLFMNNLIGTNGAGTLALGNTNDGIVIVGGDSNAFIDNVISANGDHGIETASNPKKLVLGGNRIGTTQDGSAALGNNGDGIRLFGAPGARIITGPSGPTLVSGNTGDGILISVSPKVVIQLAEIGVNLAGSAAIGNGGDGIHFCCGFAGNATVSENLISGNTGNGIHVQGAVGNKLLGNAVGVNATLTAAIPNGDAGIRIAAANNLVSGLVDVGFVSGNTGHGIVLEAPGHDTVTRTAIGLGLGLVALSNGGNGIDVDNSVGNVIGGKTLADANAIAGNSANGVFVHNGSTGNRITGNLIGRIFSFPQPNGVDGIWLQGASGNLVQGNLIGNNTFNGISVTGATGNALRRNSILLNGTYGIDLGIDGVTANDASDPDTGANQRQNYPTISGYTNTPGKVTINGTLNSTPGTKFALEFFANSACDGSGFGEGEFYLGTKSVTTSGGGSVNFLVKLKTGSAVNNITATATDPLGNTSEFSSCVP